MVAALYASFLSLMLFYLSISVIRHRRKFQAALGVGNDSQLERLVRVHANFAEYVPFGLLMIFFVEQANFPIWTIHALGVVLVIGRISHAYGVSRSTENFKFRVFGMAATFTVLLTCSGLLFYSLFAAQT